MTKSKRIFRLSSDQSRNWATQAIKNAPQGYIVIIQEPNRTLEQNALQWPILQAFSEQLEWPVNGCMTKLIDEEWKDILTAAFRQEQPRLAQGLRGGVVMLGQRTSKFGKREFSDWADFLFAVAAEKGVRVYEEAT